MSNSNPIQRELEKLGEQWEDFIGSKRPILRWYFSPDDIELGLGFIKTKEQLDEKNPELFIHLHTDFVSADTFSYALAEEMNELIADGIADAELEAEEAPANSIHHWSAPDLRDARIGYNALFRSCLHALKSFEDYVHYLVIVITPSAIKNAAEYTQWWRNCCDINSRYQWPKNLKLVFFDTEKNSPLAQIAQEKRQDLYSLDAPVNMDAAIKAVLKEADDGSPQAAFRNITVDLQKAVGKQDKPAMEKLAAAAIALAEQHRWLDMWVVTLLTRAAGYLGMQIHDLALADYRSAQLISAQGEEENVPGCNKLRLQALICEGTCLFNANRFDEAAKAYENAATLAEIQQDSLMTLEGWRMASFCLERNGRKNMSWDYAMKALEAGSKMDEQQRAHSTLPFLAQALLRLSPNGEIDQHIHQRFNQLLGDGWQQQLKAMAC